MTTRNWQTDLQYAIIKMLKDDNSDPNAAGGFYCVNFFIGDRIARARTGLSREEWEERGLAHPYAMVGIYNLGSVDGIPAAEAEIYIDLYSTRDQKVGSFESGTGLSLLASRINTLIDQRPAEISAVRTNLAVNKIICTMNTMPYYDSELKEMVVNMRYDASVLASDFE